MNAIAPVITFDGPSGVGKGTVAQAVSEKFDWHYLDSGALYRILAFAAVRDGVSLENEAAVLQLLKSIQIDFDNGAWLDGKHVEDDIRSEVMGNKASILAKHPQIRAQLLAVQKAFRAMPGLVADGRDMGTVVFNDAQCKFYLTASAKERAKRRHKQLNELGQTANIGALFREIEERDLRDQTRVESPLRPADDAVVIDTSALTVPQVLQVVIENIAKAGLEWS